MPSLNLLPENFKVKDEKRKESAILTLVSVFILLAAILICSGIYLKKQSALESLAIAELEVEKIEEKIEGEISKSEALLIENRARNIKSVLSKHPYFSRTVEMVRGKLIEGVYLDSFELSRDGKKKSEEDDLLFLKISVIAKSYGIVIEQIASWKNSFWIEELAIGNISIDSEGKINLSVDLGVKGDLVSYREPYWDYGLAALISKANRHLKINSYNAAEAKNKNKIEISFSGVAYNEEALVLFEDDFKNDSLMENVFVFYDLSKKDDFERINFKGVATVDYDDVGGDDDDDLLTPS